AAGNPKVSWSVFIQKSPAHGPVAVLAAINAADSFPYKDNWPVKFKISTGRELVDTERYSTGDVTSTDKKVFAVPIDPDSVATAFPTDLPPLTPSELAKTEAVLNGSSGGPGEDDDAGVLKKGDQLLASLRKIGQK